MTTSTVEFYRLDPLTGSYNFLSFVENLARLSTQKEQLSILYTDLHNFYALNETRGHSYGDSVLHWLGIVLHEECNLPVYRIGGDDFAVILTNGTNNEHEELLNRIDARLNREGEQLGIPLPPAQIALIHFNGHNNYSTSDILFHLWESMRELKGNNAGKVNKFWAQDPFKSTASPHEPNYENIKRAWDMLRSIANDAIEKIITMGQVLDVTQKAANLDFISGLPNMRAALLELEKKLSSKRPFAILFVDGDNLRKFNNINYAAGDEAIQNMGKVLSEHLRPNDFIARWRTGDEFIIVLPGTDGAGAKAVGKRFCAAIKKASKSWKFPTSISVGIAVYPRHGDNINALIDAAEIANKRAKDEGKDRVVLTK